MVTGRGQSGLGVSVFFNFFFSFFFFASGFSSIQGAQHTRLTREAYRWCGHMHFQVLFSFIVVYTFHDLIL